MALDCLLIETLQQFKEGKGETARGAIEDAFIKFLGDKTFFPEFYEQPDLASKFYYQIRCGILHQAETKKSSRIIATKGEPLVRLSNDGQGLIINRKKFHEQVVEKFKHYVKSLRGPASDEDLRLKFRTKMDLICSHGHL